MPLKQKGDEIKLDFSAFGSGTPVESSRQQVEDTLAYKLGRGLAQTYRPIARTIAAIPALGEAGVDLLSGFATGQSSETISRNVNEALSRPRNLGLRVRPVGVEEDGTIKQDFGSFAGDVLKTGLQVGSVIAPGAAAAKGVPLLRTMAASAGIEGLSGTIGEAARQVEREGGITPANLLGTAAISAGIGAAIPVFGRVLGRLIPGSEARAMRSAEVVENTRKLNEIYANDATARSLTWKLTNKTPDDLSKFSSRVADKNTKLTALADEVANEEAAIRSLEDMDFEASVRPQLEEIRIAKETKVKPMRERLLKVAQENSPTKAREWAQGALDTIDKTVQKLDKRSSAYKRLTAARNVIADQARYLLSNKAELQRLGFGDLVDYGDDIVTTLRSIDDEGAQLASRKFENAVKTAKKSFKALEDAKTKPQAFIKQAQDKVFQASQSKLAQQIAKRKEALAVKKQLKDSLSRELADLEGTEEAQYVRELVREFGSLDKVKEQFAFFKGVNKDVEPTLYPKEFMDEFGSGIQKISGIGNLSGFGADAIRQMEALAKDPKTLGVIRKYMIQPLFEAVNNFAKRTKATESQIIKLTREAGIDYGKAPLFGARKFFGAGSIPEITRKRQLIFDAIENGAVDSLPQELQKVARFTKDYLDGAIERMNIIRRRLGMDEIDYRKNYLPHIQAENFFRKAGMKTEDITQEKLEQYLKMLDARNNKEKVSVFFEKQRLGGLDYEKDPIEALLAYSRYAEREMEMNMLAAKLRPFIKTIEEKVGGRTYEWFRRWMNEAVLGQASEIDKRVDGLSSTVDISKLLGSMSANYSKAALLGNVGTALAQFTTIPLALAKDVKARDVIISLMHAIKPQRFDAWIDTFAKDSKVLSTRMVRASEGLDGKSVVDQVLGGILESVDNVTAKTAWLANYRRMRRVGVSHEAAVSGADEATAKLVGMYERLFVPESMRSKSVRFFAPFQTYAFNLFNQMTRDARIIGVEQGKEGVSQVLNKQSISYLAKMVGIMIAVNYIYKNALGQEPFPITEDGNLNVRGFIPILGGYSRYGTPGTVKGIKAPFELIGAFASRDAEQLQNAVSDAKQTLRFLGVPGTAQMLKIFEGVQVAEDGYLKAGDKRIPVEGTAETLRTILNGKWGSDAAQQYLDRMDELGEKRWQGQIEGYLRQ